MMFDDILKKIKPSESEREMVSHIIEELIRKLEKNNLEVFLGGSFAKDTWISGNYDVDLFILFEEEVNISDKVENVLKKEGLRYIRVKGSRDYFKVFYKGIEFELVPILKISKVEDAKNITDLSPFHVRYIKSKIKGTKLADEIRLAKAFMKTIGVYGAESYVRGFSGYAVELLTIYYKSFYNLLKASQTWRPKVFIDIEGCYKDVNEAIKKMGKDRTKSPIIVVDPTYPIRNASSAVSVQKFAEFIYNSYLLLKNIEEGGDISKYFRMKQEIRIDKYISKARRYGANLLYLEIEGKGNSKDIKNSKALKVFKKLVKELEYKGFPILKKDVFFNDKIIGLVYIFADKLPKYRKRRGPLIWDKENLSKFLERHKDKESFVGEDGRIYVIIEESIEIENVLKDFYNRYLDSLDKFYFKLY